MAGTVQFDLVSPARRLVSVEATEVQLPGTEGDMTAMPDHSPVLTTLRPGMVRVTTASGQLNYVVTGGFADISPDSIKLLAERAVPREECTREMHDQMIEEAKEALNKARETYVNEPGLVDDAAKLLSDMVALGDHIEIS